MAQSTKWGHVERSVYLTTLTGQGKSSKGFSSIVHILCQKLETALFELVEE